MAFVLFKNKKQPVEVQVRRLGANQIEILGGTINTSGFIYYHDAEMKHQYGDFSNFTTLYRELDESYILSNDGSVYPETSETDESPVQPLREVVRCLQSELTNTQVALDENYNDTIQTRAEITDVQIALCEIYEMITGGME